MLALNLSTCLPALAEELLSIDNETVRIGIDRDRGGAITLLSSKTYPKNIVNIADPGRLIQQSYYAGNSLDRRGEGQSKSWTPWPWNPIQGGGIGSWARVTSFEKTDDQTLFSETIPKLWDMPDEEAAAIMRQWTTFEPDMPNVIMVRCEFVTDRNADDAWGTATARHQEIPACYFTRNFGDVRSYLSDGKWREETQEPGPPWGRTNPPRKAMACFEANGQGVAVFSPSSTESWNFGPHRNGLNDDPLAGPCMHVAPISNINFDFKDTYRYRYWLVLGNETNIAKDLDRLWKLHSNEDDKKDLLPAASAKTSGYGQTPGAKPRRPER